jgi:hypothetical protein
MAEAKTDRTPIDDEAPKAQSNWLSIIEEVFPRWRDRLGSSKDAGQKLVNLLCDPDTCSKRHKVYVDASGEESFDICYLDAWFWQNHLELVPDADGGDCHLAVNYRDAPFEYHGGRFEFYVRRLDVERWESRYPELAAPPSTAAAPAVSEVATQDVSLEVLSPTTPASPPAPATKGRGSRQQRMIQQIVGEEFPDGYDQIETGVIIHKVADRLKRQRLLVPKRDTFLRALGRRKD